MEVADNGGRLRHVNLITQQRKLRHLRNLAARNISLAKKAKEEQSLLETYFTLHIHENSPAFYTSEKILDSLNPTWRGFEIPHMFGCSSYIVVRVWGGHENQYSVIIEWKVHLSGLIYLGDQIHKDGKTYMPNTLIFGLIDGYYGAPDEDKGTKDSRIPTNDITVDASSVRRSYTTNSLARINMIQRAIKQTQASVNKVHHCIEEKLLSAKDKNQKLAEQEHLLLRVNLLREELRKQTASHQQQIDIVKKERNQNSERGLELSNRFQALSVEKDQVTEKKKCYIDIRESYVKTNAQLIMRRKQLISELSFIYPIHELLDDRYSICGVHLPNSEDFSGHDEVMIAVALGYVCHLVMMVSHFLHIPLRYPITHYGSISKIRDHITDKISDRDRNFPMFSKGKDKLQFSYGVYLLNKNIAQLRYFCGLGTQDLRATLYNLKSLLELRLGVRFEHGSQISVQNSLEVRTAPILQLESSNDLKTKNVEDNLPVIKNIIRTATEISEIVPPSIMQLDMQVNNFPQGSPDSYLDSKSDFSELPNQPRPEQQDWVREKFLNQNSSENTITHIDPQLVEDEFQSSDDHHHLYLEAKLRAWSSHQKISRIEVSESDPLSLDCTNENASNNKFCDVYRPTEENNRDMDQCKETGISQQYTATSCGALREVVSLD